MRISHKDLCLPIKRGAFFEVKMVTTNVIYSLGQIVLTPPHGKNKPVRKREEKEMDDYKLVEEYEGSCEDCEKQKDPPKCPICERLQF